MPATVLFVHGTGVRAERYAATLSTITRQVARHGLPIQVSGCYWGEAEGARLQGAGASIPGYLESGGQQPSEADELLALWAVLYTDPWYELRLLRHHPPSGEAPFGQEPPAVRLRRVVAAFAPSTELRARFAEVELEAYLDGALTALQGAPELDEAAQTAPSDPLDHRRAVARALVAATLVSAQDAGRPALDGATRDDLVLAVGSELHAEGLGVSEFLLRPVKGIAARMITRKLTHDRGSVSDEAAPTAGDVLRFLAHTAGARAFLRSAIHHASKPCYLLGHSLGGIICTDLLVREEVPGVSALITVGSQTPFLYEIGALPSLTYPDPLPDHVPPWLNVYDRQDILSYIGAEVFPSRVRDVSVDNGQPFPQSHSAYWTNPALWAAIEEFLP